MGGARERAGPRRVAALSAQRRAGGLRPLALLWCTLRPVPKSRRLLCRSGLSFVRSVSSLSRRR